MPRKIRELIRDLKKQVFQTAVAKEATETLSTIPALELQFLVEKAMTPSRTKKKK